MTLRFRIYTIVILLALLTAACKPGGITPSATSPLKSTPTASPSTTTPPASLAVTGLQSPTPSTAASPATNLPATLPASITPVPTSSQPISLTIGWVGQFDILSPYYSDSDFTRLVQQLWLPPAWSFDDRGNPMPTLLQGLPSLANGGISANGKTFTLKLRKGLAWSDGAPLDSADFAFTYQMATNSENINFIPDAFNLVTGIDTPDPTTVVMHFSQPDPQWLTDLWPAVLPKHILEPVFQQNGSLDDADWNSAPLIGAGPYIFAAENGNLVRFLANANYWGQKPQFNEIDLRLFPNASGLMSALADGSIDVGFPLSADQASKVQSDGFQALPAFNGYNEGWYFYLDAQKGQPALQDSAVRQAIALAFNRPKLVQDLFQGLVQPAATFWDASPYADPSLTAYPYDPEQAKRLLDQAGWVDSNGDGIRDKNSLPLALKYGAATDPARKAAQAQAQADLQAVGIKLQLLSYAPGTLFASYAQAGPAATGKLDIMEWADKPDFPDPATSYWQCSEIPSAANPNGNNWQALCDPGLDGLFQKASTEVDFPQRQQIFQEISKTIYTQVYWLGLWQDPDFWAVSAHLKNVHASPASPFYDISQWQMAP
jgi:peptide/nickel transport system substrate-binding protein